VFKDLTIALKNSLFFKAEFFKMESDVNINYITTKASEQLWTLTELTKLQLQQALAEHKTMDLSVDIKVLKFSLIDKFFNISLYRLPH
jgi:hypothetical protein